MTTLRGAAAAHVGRVRDVNQDHVLARDGLYVVADGMGGHRGGEVASELAVQAVDREFSEPSVTSLIGAVNTANTEIVARARRDHQLRGMGTTIAALALVEEDDGQVISLINVGDSRAYLLRTESADLEQISEDHSLVATLERQGQLSPEEAASHPHRNIVTRALGIDEEVLIDSWEIAPVAGDRFLLCSDGLSNEVDEPVIASTLRRIADPAEAAAELVRLANEGGGRDNISVVVVDVADSSSTVGKGDARVIGRSAPGNESSAAAVAQSTRAADEASRRKQDGRPVVRPDSSEAPKTAGTDLSGLAEMATFGDRYHLAPRSRFTWRVALFLLLLAALAGGTFAALAWFADNTYYVGVGGEAESEVVIYQGRPGGLLWFDPTEIESTGIEVEDLPSAQRRAVEAGQEETSLEAAETYVENLRNRIDRREEQQTLGTGPDTQESDDSDTTEGVPEATPTGYLP